MVRRVLAAMVVAWTLTLGAPADAVAQGGRDRLTAEEIAKDPSLKTALQAIRHLRIQWLRARMYTTTTTGAQGPETTAPVAYVNNQRQPNLDDLERVEAKEVALMRFISPTDAMTRYGPGHERGVILVDIKKP